MARLLWLVAILLIASMSANGQEIEEEKTKDSDKWLWDIQVNMGAGFYKHPLKYVEQDDTIDYLELTFSLDLYYKGFFIQSNRRRSSAAEIDFGYQVFTSEDWAVDIILKSFFEDISQEDLDKSNASHLSPRNEAIGIAMRYTHYLDDALITIDTATINIENSANGWALETFYSHLIPYRNWDIYLGAGITFLSADTVNYYVGINAKDARESLPNYRPGAAYAIETEAHAIYPLAEDWTLRLGITKSYLSDNLSNSPIGIRSNTTYFKLGFNYVF